MACFLPYRKSLKSRVRWACLAIFIFSIVGLVFFVQKGFAQQKQFSFSVVEGTEEITLGKIIGIAQDTLGYIWLGDQDNSCLVRYDGYKMVVYRNNPKDSNSLGIRHLECIYADQQGQIWIGGNDGLDRFNPRTGVFTHFKHNDSDSVNFIGGVTVILKDHFGKVWVGTTNGLDELDESTGKFTHHVYDSNDPRSLSYNLVRSIYEDHSGTLWVGTGFTFDNNQFGGLNRYNREQRNFTRYVNDPKDPFSLANNKVRAIFEDSYGNFWIGTQGSDGLQMMDRENGRFQRMRYDPSHPERLSRLPMVEKNLLDHITFICEDSTRKLWIGTYLRGLTRYDPETKTVTRFENSNGFPDNTSWTAYCSHDGVLWVATESSLLYKFDPYQKNFRLVKLGQGANSFYEDGRGGLYIGTFGKGLKFSLLNQQDSVLSLPIPGFKTDVAFGEVIGDMIKMGRDSLWIATSGGLYVFDQLKKTFSFFDQDTANKNPGKVIVGAFCKDRAGRIWIGGPAGLTVLDQHKTVIKSIGNDPKDSTALPEGWIMHAMEDNRQRIWLGYGNRGILVRFDGASLQKKKYDFDAGYSDLYKDSRGRLWAWTSNGLYNYDDSTEQFKMIRETKAELNTSLVQGLLEGREGRLWVSTPSVLYDFDPATNEWIAYGRKYGIGTNSLGGKIYKSSDGQLMLGYANGYLSIPLQDLQISPVRPKLRITGFYIDNKLVSPTRDGLLRQPIEELETLELPHNKNSFGFNFAAFDFADPEKNLHYTRLANYDTVWRKAGPDKYTAFFNLPPGKYVFEIKASNSNGIFSYRSINIIIHPPWWQTWWAYALYAIALIAGSYLVYRSQKTRIIRTEREKTREKELAQAKEIEKAYHTLKETQAQLVQSEKMASLGELTAGIAHEIQNPLNFVNNFSELNKELILDMNFEMDQGNYDEAKKIAKDIVTNEEKIGEHGKRADAIVKGMLQHSRVNTGVRELTDINALCDEYLRLCYHGLRAKDKTFNSIIETNFDPTLPKIEVVPQDIGRVLLNICNNAFFAVNERRKSDAGFISPTVNITTKNQGNKVEVRISDNGIGIPEKILEKIFQPFFTTKPTGQGTGLGLSMSYDIIKAHGGQILVNSKERQGTTFVIEIPKST